MKNYVAVQFNVADADIKDFLCALLADAGFEGFEDTNTELKAFIPNELFDIVALKELLTEFELTKNIGFTTEEILPTNWNAEWEKNFQPVYVANKIQIRASFHANENYPIDIVIDPKMSFGTGHHETTFMMSEMMLETDFDHKTVFDFGSGTGILSILAAKLGAESVYALDHEEWAYHNCVENALLNNVSCIEAVYGDEEKFPTNTFDIILANINRNIIAKNLAQLALLMKPESHLLISGFLISDTAYLLDIAAKNYLKPLNRKEKNGWVCISLAKENL
jgi:ribosomal protein L11 methyltransferase